LPQAVEGVAAVVELSSVARAEEQLHPDGRTSRNFSGLELSSERLVDDRIEVPARPGARVGELYGYSSGPHISARIRSSQSGSR
jgi:hypothetical protein